jgi:hypothetical protein
MYHKWYKLKLAYTLFKKFNAVRVKK